MCDNFFDDINPADDFFWAPEKQQTIIETAKNKVVTVGSGFSSTSLEIILTEEQKRVRYVHSPEFATWKPTTTPVFA